MSQVINISKVDRTLGGEKRVDKIAKLVQTTTVWFITSIATVYIIYIYIIIVNGVYKPTYNWGAPQCR